MAEPVIAAARGELVAHREIEALAERRRRHGATFDDDGDGRALLEAGEQGLLHRAGERLRHARDENAARFFARLRGERLHRRQRFLMLSRQLVDAPLKRGGDLAADQRLDDLLPQRLALRGAKLGGSMNGRVLFSKFSPAANATSTTATRPWGGGAGRFPGCSTNITSTQLS